jgi:hypothetical protein
MTSDELSTINGCGINPTDSYAYCAARVSSSSNGASKIRLIRFSAANANANRAQFEYVAVLPVPTDNNPAGGNNANDRLPNTATFSTNGNYWMAYPELNNGEFDSTLWVIPNTHSLPGFANPDDAGLADFSSLPGQLTGITSHFADMVVVTADYKSTGSLEEYGIVIVEVENTDDFRVIFVASPNNQHGYSKWERSINNLSPYTASDVFALRQFGAAWNFMNQVFFSSNSGEGVYQIMVSEFSPDVDAAITAQRSGPSSQTASNDGLNCLSAAIPFTLCSDGAADGGPITNADCQAHNPASMVKPGSQNTACSSFPGAPCDIGGDDYSRCCEVPVPTTPGTTTTEGPEFNMDLGNQGTTGRTAKSSKGGVLTDLSFDISLDASAGKKGKKGKGYTSKGKKGKSAKLGLATPLTSSTTRTVSGIVMVGGMAVGIVALVAVKAKKRFARASEIDQELVDMPLDVSERTPLV